MRNIKTQKTEIVRSVAWLLVFGLTLLSTFEVCDKSFSGDTTEKKDSNRESLRLLSESYIHNREAFSFFSCRFQQREGLADDLEAALRGDLVDVIERDIVWIVNKDKVKYTKNCDEISVKKVAAKHAVKGEEKGQNYKLDLCGASAVLFDGKILLRHAPEIAGANIIRSEDVRPGISWTPFGMGIMGSDDERNPAALFKECLSGKHYGIAEGFESVQGRKLMKASIGKTKEKIVGTYWLDPTRGFLPIRIEFVTPQTGKLSYVAIVKDVLECSGRRWFPTSSIVVDQPHRKNGPLRVRDFKVLKLDVDNEPKDEDFYLDIPAGTQISDVEGKNGAFFTVDGKERIRVSELGKLVDRADAYASKRKARNEEKTVPNRTFWLLLINFVIVLCIGLIFLKKRFLKKK